GRERLEEHGRQVGEDDDPEQLVAEQGASADVGGEVAGIHVGDRGYEGGAQERQEGQNSTPAFLQHGASGRQSSGAHLPGPPPDNLCLYRHQVPSWFYVGLRISEIRLKG